MWAARRDVALTGLASPGMNGSRVCPTVPLQFTPTFHDLGSRPCRAGSSSWSVHPGEYDETLEGRDGLSPAATSLGESQELTLLGHDGLPKPVLGRAFLRFTPSELSRLRQRGAEECSLSQDSDAGVDFAPLSMWPHSSGPSSLVVTGSRSGSTHGVTPSIPFWRTQDKAGSWGNRFTDNEWWRKGLDAYRYSPTAAALLVPWGALSLRREESSGGLRRSVSSWEGSGGGFRAVLPRPLSSNQRGVLLLVLFPLAAVNLRNRQQPLGLGFVACNNGGGSSGWSWWRAAIAVVLASVFKKIYPLALGLLIALIAPRRFLEACRRNRAGDRASFSCRPPAYVASQFGQWVHFLRSDVRQHVLLDRAARDVGFLLRVVYWPVDEDVYMAMEVVAGLSAAAACLASARAGWQIREQLLLAFGLGTLWMTLSQTAVSEACTYLLIAPSLAWCLIQARTERRGLVVGGLLVTSCLLFLIDQIWSWVRLKV